MLKYAAKMLAAHLSRHTHGHFKESTFVVTTRNNQAPLLDAANFTTPIEHWTVGKYCPSN